MPSLTTLPVPRLLDVVSGGLATRLLYMDSGAVAGGQVWRLLTASLSSGSFLGVLMNLVVLWLAGRALESELGIPPGGLHFMHQTHSTVVAEAQTGAAPDADALISPTGAKALPRHCSPCPRPTP